MEQESKPPITTGTLFAALEQRYQAPEWLVLSEVQNGKGGARYADAIAVSLWASRGIRIFGFEIKRTRADWLRELKQPAKSEAFHGLVDAWWLVAPKGIVERHELPVDWGYLELRGERLVAVHQPAHGGHPLTKDVGRRWFAALLQRCIEAAGKPMRLAEEEIHREVERRVAERLIVERQIAMRDGDQARRILAGFEAVAGFPLPQWETERFARIAKILQDVGPERLAGNIRLVVGQWLRAAENAKTAADLLEALVAPVGGVHAGERVDA